MNIAQQQRFNTLYQQHLINLRLQGKRPSTIDAYARAVRRITEYFDCVPDTLTTVDLKKYFNSLIQTHSWSTIKLDRIASASCSPPLTHTQVFMAYLAACAA
ncbi:phage integrase N-terminal SAM-like domain-containing protein [Alteromonadales bacterium alter-6D02]|uniref:phage integrase N-terminal SAM-like domain-containing protein n=1 Tax=Psychrobium sp. 1_MG-2023 TaxID=3062624 RepID=UPI000C33EF0B|nr:hypothetical protein CW748_17500 [Alteromonadales bacterium alter-6D02]